jgi:hypothetical protein
MTIDAPKVTSIGEYCFNGNYFQTVSMPELVTVDKYAFQSCSSIQSFNFPKLETIKTYGFYSCGSLRNVTLPSVEKLDTQSFGKCTALEYAVLSSVTSIGSSSFSGCTSLQYIDFSGCVSVPKLVSVNAFSNVPTTCQFRVPAHLIDEWKAATNWSSFVDQIVVAE